MKPLLSAALCCALAACAVPMGGAVPDQVRLSTTSVALLLSNGQTCRADWQAAPSGQFADCAGFAYAVEEVANPNILRQIWAGLTRALTMDGAVTPLAKVTITAPDGRVTTFASPPPTPL